MNMYRRVLAALLITLSCLFALQSTGAANALVPVSFSAACVDAEALPDNFPDWIETPACLVVESDEELLTGSGTSCEEVTTLPANFPDWIETPACSFVESDAELMSGSGSVCGDAAPLPANFPDWLEKPTCSFVESDDETAAVSDEPDILRGRPSNIGPTI